MLVLNVTNISGDECAGEAVLKDMFFREQRSAVFARRIKKRKPDVATAKVDCVGEATAEGWRTHRTKPWWIGTTSLPSFSIVSLLSSQFLQGSGAGQAGRDRRRNLHNVCS